jgi:AraC family transcriptional regulator, arabinose operon regulatory protein
MASEVVVPVAARVLAGAFEEGPGYATYRRDGTTDWLLIHTVAGRGRFGTGHGEHVAGPGDTMLLSPGTLHDYGVETELQRWLLAFAHFHPRPDWRPLLGWPELAPGLGRIHSSGRVGRRIAHSLRQAARYSISGLPHNELFALNALEMALLWCDTQNPLARRIDERLVPVLEHVDRNLAEPLDASRLAGVAGLSVSRFTHLFTEGMGISPQRYVEGQRLELARRLLDFTSRPIRVIARHVGYTDVLYFSTRFRQRTGMSPMAYRRRTTRPEVPTDGRTA